MKTDSRIYVAGHRGLVGSAIARALKARGHGNLLLQTHAQLDLTDARAVEAFFQREKPQYVFMAAAKVGGIHANDVYSGDFIRENLLVQTHVIDCAHRHGVEKLLFLGSTCIYPKLAPQPLKEEYLLTGLLEPTNDAYAVAKIAGIQMVKAYAKQFKMRGINVMPTNLYGPNDNFELENSHVLPAMMRRLHDAKKAGAPFVTMWGSGAPKREFLHVDDLAEACLFLMDKHESTDIINVGVGEDVSIKELAELVREVVGFEGSLKWDTSKPDGTPRKLVDVTRINALGWKASIKLRDGIQSTYRWFLENAHRE